MRLWDISSGKCVSTFLAQSEVNAICMFPNGGAIAYATEQGQFGLFDVGSHACVSMVTTTSYPSSVPCYSALVTYTYSSTYYLVV